MPAPSLFLNDFTVLDFAFLDAAGTFQGESFYVSAELSGALDARDFLFDFSVAKKALKALVDEELDHKLVLPQDAVTREGAQISWKDGEYSCPAGAVVELSASAVTIEAIATHLAQAALPRLPANIERVVFRLTSPARFLTEASFRYTHGLQFHEGNCQRLFHGHRNPVEVWVEGVRSPAWEARLAAEWDGAHFVALPTLRNRESLDLPLGQRRPSLGGFAEVSYQGSQGAFRGRIPASRVVLTEAEPSIETMSALAFAWLREMGLVGQLRVVAFEGLNKGAACEG